MAAVGPDGPSARNEPSPLARTPPGSISVQIVLALGQLRKLR